MKWLTDCSVDVKELKLYQQLYIYFVPMVTNMGFINIIVVVVRLFWFKKHLKQVGMFVAEDPLSEPATKPCAPKRPRFDENPVVSKTTTMILKSGSRNMIPKT